MRNRGLPTQSIAMGSSAYQRTPHEVNNNACQYVPFPEISVRQPAATSLCDDNVEDWVQFLNQLGEENEGLGRARSLGSIAITHIKAKEMGKMLEAKWPGDYRSPERARSLQYKLKRQMLCFMHEAAAKASDARPRRPHTEATDERTSIEDIIGSSGFGFQEELEDPGDFNEFVDDEADTESSLVRPVLTKEHTRLSSQPVFGRAVYRIHQSGLQPYGKNRPFGEKGWGLNLDLNESLNVQRQLWKGFLGRRGGLGLDTGLMEPWDPHVVIFDLMQHLTIASAPVEFDPQKVSQPSSMSFKEPHVWLSKMIPLDR